MLGAPKSLLSIGGLRGIQGSSKRRSRRCRKSKSPGLWWSPTPLSSSLHISLSRHHLLHGPDYKTYSFSQVSVKVKRLEVLYSSRNFTFAWSLSTLLQSDWMLARITADKGILQCPGLLILWLLIPSFPWHQLGCPAPIHHKRMIPSDFHRQDCRRFQGTWKQEDFLDVLEKLTIHRKPSQNVTSQHPEEEKTNNIWLSDHVASVKCRLIQEKASGDK